MIASNVLKWKSRKRLQLTGTTIANGSVRSAARVEVEILSGTAPYRVRINDKTVGQYHKKRFSVPADQGDKVEVFSGVACEGKLLVEIPRSGETRLYPNPTGSDVELVLPQDRTSIAVAIYNVSGVQVSSKLYAVNNRKARIKMKELPAGTYFLHLENENPTIVKIIKR